MEKECTHGKWLKLPKETGPEWVSFYNQIDNDTEKCCVCGKLNSNPLPDYKNEDKRVEDLIDESEQMEKIEDKVDLHFRLKHLPERIQEIAGHIKEGKTYKEIGEIMGCSEQAIKDALYRNRKKHDPKA